MTLHQTKSKTHKKSKTKSTSKSKSKSKHGSKSKVKSLKQSKKKKKMKGGEDKQYIVSGSYRGLFDGVYSRVFAEQFLKKQNDKFVYDDNYNMVRTFIDYNKDKNFNYTFGNRIKSNNAGNHIKNHGKNDGMFYIHSENPNLIIYCFNAYPSTKNKKWFIQNLNDGYEDEFSYENMNNSQKSKTIPMKNWTLGLTFHNDFQDNVMNYNVNNLRVNIKYS